MEQTTPTNKDLHEELALRYNDPEVELRHLIVGPFTRASANSRDVEGYAAMYERKTSIGWFDEIIKAGAFDGVIEPSDIRALFNHDPNHLLARKRPAGTSGFMDSLSVWTDDTGLRYGFEVPKTRDDILEMIARGDLGESSFAFTIDSYDWITEDGRDLRQLIKFKRLYDVAPVTYPAYNDTTVAKRSLDALKKDTDTLKEDRDNAQAELIKRRGRVLFFLNNKQR